MAQRKRSRSSSSRGRADSAQAVRDSAQKIWLAGLGAFERARTEGPRMFEGLVAQGRDMGARAVGMADQALRSVREGGSAAGGRFDKLEQVFQDRVARSLKHLGVLTQDQVDELARQVRELNESLQKLGAARAPRGRATRKAKATRKTKATRKSRAPAKAARRTTRKAGSRSKAKRGAS